MVNISKQTVKRLPYYLHYLDHVAELGCRQISAAAIARDLHLNDVQVRKDLAAVSANGGKPRTGYQIAELISDIKTFLGYDNVDQAVLVGAGKLGSALLSYQEFGRYGIEIVAAFDLDERPPVDGKPVLPLDKLSDLCRRMQIHIGILTVPAKAAQQCCDLLVSSGICAVWNFAPVHLSVPDGILVQNENMAESLALLSQHLSDRFHEKPPNICQSETGGKEEATRTGR